MSTKKKSATKPLPRSRSGKRERYLQPSILAGLLEKDSYGYELIRKIGAFGFLQGRVPPGMIYRHLRQLEEDGLVSSQWQTEGTGPAKRVYRISAEGKAVMELWIDHMQRQAEKLQGFVKAYQDLVSASKRPK